MRKLIFNENGDAIDEETGQIIGSQGPDGKLVISPSAMEKINRTNRSDNGQNSQNSSNAKVEDNQKEPLQQSSESIQQKNCDDHPKVSIPTPVQYSKYEVRPDSEFTVQFCLKFSDNGQVSVYAKDSFLQLDNLEKHWAKFRMWTYKESLEWKNQCMEFDQQIRSFKQNNCKLNELKIRHLIKDWSFSEIDPKFKLLHVNGVLSDESYEMMMGLYPQILDNILILMNNVLE